MKHKLLKGEFVLFEFESYRNPTVDVLQFYNCTLSIPIGNFKVGDIIPTIVIHFVRNGTLQVFDKEVLLSEHNYTCIGWNLEEGRVISLSSDSNIREMLLVDK